MDTEARAAIPNARVAVRSLLGAVAIGAAWCYASAILLLREAMLPIELGAVAWYVAALIVVFASFALLFHALRRGVVASATVANTSVSLLVSVGALVIADIAFAVFGPSARVVDTEPYGRAGDPQTWVGELLPRLYYPTDRSFRLHKPGTSVRGDLYGIFYRTSMKSSPTLMGSVLERHSIEIAINGQGFRDSGSMSEASIFALGDSLTFGWGVNENETWVDILDGSLESESIFNLGIHDASPMHEVALVEYVLRTFGRPGRLNRILWMIYEGNDLEDDYAEYRQDDLPTGAGRARVAGTLLELILDFPATLKAQAIVTKLATRQVVTRQTAEESRNHYVVDGVQIPFALYHSPKLGYTLFYPPHIERAQNNADYVLNHPNRASLEKAFARMASLAAEFDFEVVVLLTPTSTRLHGPYFEGFPLLSEPPHFLDFVATLSGHEGFETVDLHALLKRQAGLEMLYFRDDDHLNRRGNEVIANLVRQSAFAGN
jgi:hypothetical protein